ncbi:MAG: hypothetical protein M2R45_01482 [Verrucomicrobia subdivision 3 bacterium]|nr:hypothetical protein [Limisphaerales bacterium]MCS1413388.1 hypothetical protein [Limisphaerales bacterium]
MLEQGIVFRSTTLFTERHLAFEAFSDRGVEARQGLAFKVIC